MKKSFKKAIILLIIIFLLVSLIAFLGRRPFLIEGKIYHTTDIDELDLNGPLLPVSIESIDCYYSLQEDALFPNDRFAPLTGRITLTSENYQTIISMYNDWIEVTGFPPSPSVVNTVFARGIYKYASEEFLEFAQKEKYLFSEQFMDSEQMIALVSTDENVIYFYLS